MLVGVFDVPAITVLGAASAFLYQRYFRAWSVNWYVLLTGLGVSLFWINVVVANRGTVPYWLVESPVVSVDAVVGIPYVLAYPLWFRLAGEVTFTLVGRRADQGGILWVFRLSDRTEPIEPSWRTDDQEDDR